MPGFSNVWELKVLDFLWGSTQPALGGTHYLALASALPAETDVNVASELSYTGYARVAAVNNTGTWSAASAGQKKNAIALFFATCTAGSGTATAFAIMDALTVGTIIAYGSLVTNKIISTGDVAQFAANDLVINLD